MQLTCATLGAFTKYPRESLLQGCRYQGVSAKKHGFFVQDREAFREVADNLGLISRDQQDAIWCRHPLAFLVEAADDICYRVIDIEDGFRLGFLGYQEVLELFLPALGNPDDLHQRMGRISGDKERVEFLRAKVINEAIGQVRDCFLDLESAILDGRFDRPLLGEIPISGEMEQLIEVAREKIYCTPQVVEVEAAGFQVIGELLENLIQVLDDIAEHGANATPKSLMTQYLVPEQFIGTGRTPSDDFYLRLLGLTDFVAGMTDSYAVSLYKKLTGISLPGG
jgi:dGTPase